MSRTQKRNGLLTLSLGATLLVGCENLPSRQAEITAVTPDADPDLPGLSEAPEDLKEAGVKPGSSAGFFRSNRRAGGWSQEAREIEGHFNIQ